MAEPHIDADEDRSQHLKRWWSYIADNRSAPENTNAEPE
jgi:hypothetical protein